MERTMVPVFLFLTFFCVCFVAWMLMFPHNRTALADVAGRLRIRLPAGRHALLVAGLMLAVCLPPLLALTAGGRITLPGFEEQGRSVNVQIEALLKGEQLVPPQPLPPAMFTTAEVELVRPQLAGASRNWQLLDAEFAQRLLLVFRIMREKHGYEMVLLEGYRSPERQNQLAAAGSHVTNARAFQSYHQYGLASDCAFLREGKLLISEKDPWAMRGYQLYGETAEALGLTWGGRWTMMDFGHVELRRARR
ncbi:M15 family metallopeptidase [Massilia sp. erpn]|nr:M15 family metallopeptidase [Massilia sp. erpn]